MLKILWCMMSLLLVSSLTGQTPEQSYFEWTSLPFSKEELAGRRSNLIRTLKEEGAKGLALFPARDGRSHGETFRQLDDFYYFTGLELPNSILVIDIESETSAIYAPERDIRFESTSRPNDFPGRPIVADPEISNRAGIDLKSMPDFVRLMDNKASAAEVIFVNSGRGKEVKFPTNNYIDYLTPEQLLLGALKQRHPGLKYQNVYEALAKIRMIKSPTEIEVMRKATDINVLGIKDAARAVKPGVDERYLEGVLEGSYKINGSPRLAFGSIIKSGPNSLWPWRILATHYERRNRKMIEGDLVIFDVGCEVKNYVSDVGRTFPVSGKFSERQREILEMEVGISDQIIDFLEPGITFRDIKRLTDRIIPDDAKKYMQVGLFFGHHLGLSTGDPNLPEAKLKAGMIFTVEPWYYNHDEEISVFTEDVILITESGCEVLSKDLPRTPDGLEALMKSE